MQNLLFNAFSGMHDIVSEKRSEATSNGSPENSTKSWLAEVRQYLTKHMSGLFSDSLFYYVTNADTSSGMPFYSLFVGPQKIELVERAGPVPKKSEFLFQTDQVLINKHDTTVEEAGFFLKKLAFIAQDIHTYHVPVFAEKRIGGRR